MKILYVSPENVSGGFGLFAAGHRIRGNHCRYITFFRNRYGFEDDLCFNLRLTPDKSWLQSFRKFLKKRNNLADIVDLAGNPPFWKPFSKSADLMFRLRDKINEPRIRKAIEKHKLNEFDVYHFEQGIDPFRDGRWVRELSKKGKGIVCFYHGGDLRNRGVIESVHRHSQLNLTSEIDLLQRMKGMKYLFLPIDTNALKPNPRKSDGRIRIGHAARNRMFKGSDFIEQTVLKLAERYPIDWIMIENVPHDKALEMKSTCDIFIDQITDAGGWGYGASSVESLSMGIPTMTKINQGVADFLDGHPFIPINHENLEKKLFELIEDEDLRIHFGKFGREWAIKHHDVASVMDALYGYYKDAGMI